MTILKRWAAIALISVAAGMPGIREALQTTTTTTPPTTTTTVPQ